MWQNWLVIVLIKSMASPQSVSAYRLLSRVFKCLVTLGWRYDSLPPSHHHPPYKLCCRLTNSSTKHHPPTFGTTSKLATTRYENRLQLQFKHRWHRLFFSGVKPNLTHTHTHTRDDLPHLEQPPPLSPAHHPIGISVSVALWRFLPFSFWPPFRHSDALYLFLIFSGSLISVRCCFSRK